MPGPVPKRSAERRRRNLDNRVETAPPLVDVVVAPEADPAWHAIAHNWYEALVDSGQSQFFEPSDWAAAFLAAEAMTRLLKAEKFSAVLFASVWSAMGDLLTTEADRRRLRLEIERGATDTGPSAGVTAIDAYRKRAGLG